MLRRFKRTNPLDEPINAVLAEMATYGPDSPEYKKHLKSLERLEKLKSKNRRRPISKDTALVVLGNLGGILIIVIYEQKHVMVSKAMGFIHRPKQ